MTTQLKAVQTKAELADIDLPQVIRDIRVFAHHLCEDCYLPNDDEFAATRRAVLAHELKQRLDALQDFADAM